MLPVNNAAISLDSAIPRLPNRAAYTAFLDRSFNLVSCYHHGYTIIIVVLLFDTDIVTFIISLTNDCLSFIMYYILLINVDLLLFLIGTVWRVISIIFISDTYNQDLLDVNF